MQIDRENVCREIKTVCRKIECVREKESECMQRDRETVCVER